MSLLRSEATFAHASPYAPMIRRFETIEETTINGRTVNAELLRYTGMSDGYAKTGRKVYIRGLDAMAGASGAPEAGVRLWCIWMYDTSVWEILCSGGGANSVAVTDTIIPGRSGNTPGGPIKVQRKKLDDLTTPTFVDDGNEVDVYSWVKADSTDPALEVGGLLWIFIEQDPHGVWWFTGQDCPPAEA